MRAQRRIRLIAFNPQVPVLKSRRPVSATQGPTDQESLDLLGRLQRLGQLDETAFQSVVEFVNRHLPPLEKD